MTLSDFSRAHLIYFNLTAPVSQRSLRSGTIYFTKEQGMWSASLDVQLQFSKYAEKLGLDVNRFKKDVVSDGVKMRIEADQERARQLGVTYTPTLFINDWPVPRPSYSVAGLSTRVSMMDESIGKKQTP